MKFKIGAIVQENRQYQFMAFAVDHVWKKHFGHEAMITSGCEALDADGKKVKHSPVSLHWQNLAWDVRIHRNNDPAQGFISADKLKKAVEDLKVYLGCLFDVVLESDHIHIEFDPK